MVPKSEEDSQDSMGETSEFQINNLDELLINLVKERPALYDIRVPQQERTKIMKQALWFEISKCMNGQMKPEAAEIRWKYLRENFLKARKKQKIKEDIARRAGMTLRTGKKKYSFRYHEIMEFLNEPLDYQKIITLNNASKTKPKIQRSQKFLKTQTIQETSKLPTTKVQTTPKIKMNPLVNMIDPIQYVNVQSMSVTNNNEETNADTQMDAPDSPFSPQTSDESSSNAKNKNKFDSYDKIFLECLQKPIEKPSPIDGFLLRLGEGMRRLPYKERSKLELEFLTRLHDVEEQLELCDDN